MRVVHDRCCGLDVHKRTVVACVLTREGSQTRTFGTMTEDLLDLADWLAAEAVTHVAMESTGVYWRPVFNLLEGSDLEVLVVNAQHIKAVPGRKTDVKDAEWIAELLRYGLLRGSVIPDRPQRELRELVRFRTSLLRQRGQAALRIQKVLEGANIKLSSLASDILGVSGRAMLEALVAGIDDPARLAELARGRMKHKRAALTAALRGQMGPHQRLLIGSLLRQVDHLDTEIETMSSAIAEQLRPHLAAVERLDTIPGVGRHVAEMLLAEIGPEVTRFPTAAHLASWAKLCPGNNESAGKRRHGRTGQGNPWLRSTLVEAAWAAARTKDTYLAAQFRHLAPRRGVKRALVAVAHSILIIVYHLLKEGATYQDLGGNFFDERQREATTRRTVRRLERLGYKVTLTAA